MKKHLQTKNLPVLFFTIFCIKLIIAPDILTLAALVPTMFGVIFSEYSKYKLNNDKSKDELDRFYEAKKEMETRISLLSDKVTNLQVGNSVRKLR